MLYLHTVTACIVTFLDTVTGRLDTCLDRVHMGAARTNSVSSMSPSGGGAQGALLDQTVQGGAGNPQVAGGVSFTVPGHTRVSSPLGGSLFRRFATARTLLR